MKIRGDKETPKTSVSPMPRERAEHTVSTLLARESSPLRIPIPARVFTVVFNKHLHKSLEGGKKKSAFFHTIPQK